MIRSGDKKTSGVELSEGIARGHVRFEWGRVCYTLERYDKARQWRVHQGENVLTGVCVMRVCGGHGIDRCAL